MIKLFTFLFLLFSTSFVCSGSARWVNNQGGTAPAQVVVNCVVHNTAGGTYTTIQAAINAAVSGDVIYITDGVYRNAFETTSTNCLISGTGQDFNLYLDINTKTNIIITSSTGSYCNSSVRLVGFGVNLRGGSNITIQGLHLDSIRVNGFWNSNCCSYLPSQNVNIRNNRISNTRGHGIKTDGLEDYNRTGWVISGNFFENIGFYNGYGNCLTPGPVSAIWLSNPYSFTVSNNTITNTRWAGVLCDGYNNITISGNRVDNTVDAGIQIGFPSSTFYYPTPANINNNRVTNANTSNKVGIAGITILQSNVRGVSVTNNDVSTSFNGLAIQIAGWQNSFDAKLINNNNFYNLTPGSFGVTHIAGIAPNGLFGTGDDLTFYNLTNNYWGAASGPTYTTNPGGTGSGLLKETTLRGTSPPGGLVYSINDFVYTPFLTSPATVNAVVACASVPTVSNTISLTSAVGTNAQTICLSGAITPISYNTTQATGATITGLPAGVTGSWAANVVTISGKPTTTVGSPFTYTITLVGGCGALVQTGTITVNAISSTLAATTGGATVCQNAFVANTGSSYAESSSCRVINTILPSGASPVTGLINSCVKIDATVQTYNGFPYAQRHYDIEPLNSPATATATITLYYTQADMDNYNAARGVLPALPTGSGDAAGKANLLITQYHGIGTLPGNYPGTATLINPVDANIIWNATLSRWEVTFDVAGFSGFYLHTNSRLVPLQVSLVSFSGTNNNTTNLLQWLTSAEQGSILFEIERSTDAITFSKVGNVTSFGNSTINRSYFFTDDVSSISSQLFYYRLKMIDKNGSFKYSAIVKLEMNSKGFIVEVVPNPFTQSINIRVHSENTLLANVQLIDLAGRIVNQKNISLQKGSNIVLFDQLESLPTGTYMMKVKTAAELRTIKIIKR